MDYIDYFNLNNILICNEFYEEFATALLTCKDRKAFDKKLAYCIALMNEMPNTYYCNNSKHFESIKGSTDILSIKIKTGMNLRILHARTNSKFLFILAFIEKEGKKATDYSTHLKVASERLKRHKERLGGVKYVFKR